MLKRMTYVLIATALLCSVIGVLPAAQPARAQDGDEYDCTPEEAYAWFEAIQPWRNAWGQALEGRILSEEASGLTYSIVIGMTQVERPSCADPAMADFFSTAFVLVAARHAATQAMMGVDTEDVDIDLDFLVADLDALEAYAGFVMEEADQDILPEDWDLEAELAMWSEDAEEASEEAVEDEPELDLSGYPDLTSVVTADGRFSTLLLATGMSPDVAAAMAEDELLTIFAPTDEAFAALPPDQINGLMADPAMLDTVVKHHVVEGLITASDLAEMDTLTTMAGLEITVEATDDGVLLNGEIVITEADLFGSNGVIHVIDGVLIPPEEGEVAADVEEPVEEEAASEEPEKPSAEDQEDTLDYGSRSNPYPLGEWVELETGRFHVIEVNSTYIPAEDSDEYDYVMAVSLEYECIRDDEDTCTGAEIRWDTDYVTPDGVVRGVFDLYGHNAISGEVYSGATITGDLYIRRPEDESLGSIRYEISYGEYIFLALE